MKIELKKWLNILKHVSIIGAGGSVLLIFFFYIYLPGYTNHGETITVPDLEGMHVNRLEEFLLDRNLRYDVSDSSYSSKYEPLMVLSQFPKAGSRVKEGRKVYLTLNSLTPPTTRMPNLIDRSLRNAQLELGSYELVQGKIQWRASPYQNAILDQKFNGNSIEPGTKIEKGSVIDLVVGDGFGNRTIVMPSFIGDPLDEVVFTLSGYNLRVGSIVNQGDSSEAPGFIYRHIPEEGEVVKVGEVIDLWVTPSDSLLRILLAPLDTLSIDSEIEDEG